MTPLTRASITVASRIMLPAYVILFTVAGFNYAVTPISRLGQSPALAYADTLMPLRVWGCLFLAVAALMLVALASGQRLLFCYGLLVCVICMGIWAAVFLLGAIFADASPAAWAWPAFVGVACIATYRSLSVYEVS